MTKKSFNPKPIRKNKTTEVVFSFKTFENNSKLYLDIREKIVSGDFTGHTKKGLCFDVKLIPEFIKNLQLAEEYLTTTPATEELIEIMSLIEKAEKINFNKAEKLIKYCYENSYYKEAVDIFKLLDEEHTDEEKLKEINKIIEVCRMKIE